MRLRRFWFEFDDAAFLRAPSVLGLGCGVTAWTEHDALVLLQQRVFHEAPMPRIKGIIHDVDVSTLDAGHVLPNMLPPNRRGIWFPQGYD
jgi:hypothetical protein